MVSGHETQVLLQVQLPDWFTSCSALRSESGDFMHIHVWLRLCPKELEQICLTTLRFPVMKADWSLWFYGGLVCAHLALGLCSGFFAFLQL